jgi:hypothetical protein
MNARDEARAALAAWEQLPPSPERGGGRSLAAAIRALLDEPVPGDEREALVTRTYNRVTGSDGEDWDPDSTLAALFELFDTAAGFRRKGPVTDAQVTAVADALMLATAVNGAELTPRQGLHLARVAQEAAEAAR